MTKTNGLKKMPLSRIKDMIRFEGAKRVLHLHDVPQDCVQIGYSQGVRGINGYLYKSANNKYYAITCN